MKNGGIKKLDAHSDKATNKILSTTRETLNKAADKLWKRGVY